MINNDNEIVCPYRAGAEQRCAPMVTLVTSESIRIMSRDQELAELRARCEHLATERDMVKGQFDRACEDIGELRQRLTEAEKDAFLWRSVAGHFSIEAGLTEVTYYCRGTGQVVCRTSNMDVVNSASDRNRLAEAEGLLRKNRRDFEVVVAPMWKGHPFTLAIQEIDAFLANRTGEPAGGQLNGREGVTLERDPVASTCTWLG